MIIFMVLINLTFGFIGSNNMAKYLGEFDTDVYDKMSKTELIMLYVTSYGGIDGDHHKTWVIDQVARIALGTKVIHKIAKWDNGEEDHRFRLDTPSKKYLKWVKEAEDDGYEIDEGIAP